MTYPESMRQDGIFLQDMNIITGRVEGYFLRYENRKDSSRFYHKLKHMNKNQDSMGGYLFNQIRDGYEIGFGGGVDFLEIDVKTGKPRESQPDSTRAHKPGWTMPEFGSDSGIPGIPGLGG